MSSTNLFSAQKIRAGEYAGGRKIGLERVKDQEKRREQENHNVGLRSKL
jgi:hypothetical protein